MSHSLPLSTPVLIIGGGPVGSALALDLAWRGVPVLVAEREPVIPQEVRARGINARTMEHFRRLGLADGIRAADTLPPAWYGETAVTPAVLATPFHVVPRTADELSVPTTGSSTPPRVAELPHILPQPQTVALLRDRARALGARFATGWEVVRLWQSPDEVVADLREVTTGRLHRITADYAVGTDGGRSLVRDVAGITSTTTVPTAKRFSVTFRSDDIFNRTEAAPRTRFLIPRDGSIEMVTTHALGYWGFGLGPFPLDFDFSTIDLKAEAHRLIGADADIEIEMARPWPVQRSVADRYRAGRLFLAGDAAHTSPPTGGQNMNTGIGDAMNLSWKLAAVLQGWGEDGLLDSYHDERRPIGDRNTTWALATSQNVPGDYRPARLGDPSAARGWKPAIDARSEDRRVRGFSSLDGIVLDLRYASDIIVEDERTVPAWSHDGYAEVAKTGHRAPHRPLASGVSLYDLLGPGYTLINFGGDPADLVDAASASGVPLTLLELDEPELAALYDAALVIVRPDQQIAWHGNRAADAPADLFDRLRGAARVAQPVA